MRPSALIVRATLVLAGLVACQPGAITTPAVSPVPQVALGLPVFLVPDPVIGSVDEPEGRPIAVTFEHAVRDAAEEAGMKLVATAGDSGGVVLRVVIQRVGAIHADLFIKGSEACGVRVELVRGDAVVASAQPEVPCLSTSAYYGMLPKDAAVTLVNAITRDPSFLKMAEHLREPAPPE
jgi:hypothetical protein